MSAIRNFLSKLFTVRNFALFLIFAMFCGFVAMDVAIFDMPRNAVQVACFLAVYELGKRIFGPLAVITVNMALSMPVKIERS